MPNLTLTDPHDANLTLNDLNTEMHMKKFMCQQNMSNYTLSFR